VGILLGLAASPPLAERNGLPTFHYVIRQLVFGIAALSGMMFLSMQTPATVRRLAVIGFVGAVIAVALLPILGTDFGKGAVRWYSLGFASVQPSEFLKPTFVVTTAWFMAASTDLDGPPGKTISFVAVVFLAGLLAMQPDFGQASLLLGAWGVIYFIAGAPVWLMIVLSFGTVGAGFMAYTSSEHFARRIDGFLSADMDPRSQIGFATRGIQEGGLFGVGVGEGSVKNFLPDAHTDFIIAVAAEEYGLILCLLIIFLFAFITVRSLFRLLRERDAFVRFAGTGLAALLALQALINLGVAVRLLPAKGMTLPFISYGGSSLLAAGLLFGFLLALTRTRPQDSLNDVLGRGTKNV
ncbi:MAG TPA: FtsW/RodA/SpoVE family cell cycle protein, partial [Paracoccaceae bacterium]|nr:FtsW/RodA/SpoVE family cell cycle protein [Paracoccaceae bacterium]